MRELITYKDRLFELVTYQGGGICKTCDAEQLCKDYTIKEGMSLCLSLDTVSRCEVMTNWKEVNLNLIAMDSKTFQTKGISPALMEAYQKLERANKNLVKVKGIVEPYRTAILQRNQYKVTEKVARELDEEAGKVILNHSEVYLLDDYQTKDYLTELHKEHLKHGFNVSYAYCPVAIAENRVNECQRNLVTHAEYITGIKLDVIRYHMKQYKKLIAIVSKACATILASRKQLNKTISRELELISQI